MQCQQVGASAAPQLHHHMPQIRNILIYFFSILVIYRTNAHTQYSMKAGDLQALRIEPDPEKIFNSFMIIRVTQCTILHTTMMSFNNYCESQQHRQRVFKPTILFAGQLVTLVNNSKVTLSVVTTIPWGAMAKKQIEDFTKGHLILSQHNNCHMVKGAACCCTLSPVLS